MTSSVSLALAYERPLVLSQRLVSGYAAKGLDLSMQVAHPHGGPNCYKGNSADRKAMQAAFNAAVRSAVVMHDNATAYLGAVAQLRKQKRRHHGASAAVFERLRRFVADPNASYDYVDEYRRTIRKFPRGGVTSADVANAPTVALASMLSPWQIVDRLRRHHAPSERPSAYFTVDVGGGLFVPPWLQPFYEAPHRVLTFEHATPRLEPTREPTRPAAWR